MERSTYSRGAIAFHWTIAVLILTNLFLGFFRDAFGEAATPVMLGLHKPIGITVLALSIGRVLWRLTHKPPPLPATVKYWERRLASAVHLALYLLIFALPLTGWLFVSYGARKYPIDYFGLGQVPWLPVVQDKAAAHMLNERHELLGYVALALLVLHLAGAFKHHFLDKDDTVARMLPLLGFRGSVLKRDDNAPI